MRPLIFGAMPETHNGARGPSRIALLGPLAFLAVLALPRPSGLGESAHALVAVTAWMTLWWVTAAVPLAVTALLPLALYPILGIAGPERTAAPYANPVIFLFMGGFFLAAAIERWGLHRRLALAVLRRTGATPRRVVAGFMIASALISMWISNTATAAMMMPIGAAVLKLAGERPEESRFGSALMLGIAYAASIGGVATLVGTPPTAILAANARELAGQPIDFARWLAFGLPISGLLLAIAWAVLCIVAFRLGSRPLEQLGEVLERERGALGEWSAGERATAAVFALAALAWVLREPKDLGPWTLPGIQTFLPQVGDETIAMAAAAVLFLTPVRSSEGRTVLLDWPHARRIPWDILILFGGGLTVAAQFEDTGLISWVGARLDALAGLPLAAVLALVTLLFTLLTELASNTAIAALAMPVTATLAHALGADPLVLMAAAALASSLGFMLPVGTPPNAIVFATGYIRAPEMARVGVMLDVAGAAAVTLAALTLFRWIFG